MISFKEWRKKINEDRGFGDPSEIDDEGDGIEAVFKQRKPMAGMIPSQAELPPTKKSPRKKADDAALEDMERRNIQLSKKI
jgi:hypothetical protein